MELIEYAAGNAAEKEEKVEDSLLNEAATILDVDKKGVAIKSAEVFKLWKDVVKKKKDVEADYSGDLEDISDKEVLEKAAHTLKTQIEHVPKTLKRFLDEIAHSK